MKSTNKRRVGLALLALATSLSTPAIAADEKGNFAIEGAGSRPCSVYTTARTKKSPDYAIFAGWVEGYLTGANQHAKDTFDFTPWQTVDLLMAALSKHCEKNPAQPFIVAVNGMLGTLKDARMRTGSEVVSAESDGRRTYAYKSVIQDIQRQLTARKLFTGPADGKFSPALRDALKAFQTRAGLAVTGLPDQPTLFNLFKPKA